MAQGQLGSPHGFVDKRRGRILTAPDPNAEKANMDTIGEMRARLITLNGIYYNTDRLNAMTVNDMIFALRDLAGI